MTQKSNLNHDDQSEEKAVDNKIRPMDSLEGGDELLLQYAAIVGENPIGSEARPTRLFANWLRHYMDTNNLSVYDVAAKMDCQEQLIAHILTGKMPVELFDSVLIEQFARLTRYDSSVIARFLGKTDIVPSNKLLDNHEQEIELNFRRILDEFVEIVTKGHSPQLSMQQREKYNKVIQTLESIIAKQKQDLDLVQRLKADLENLRQPVRFIDINEEDVRRIIHIYEQHSDEDTQDIV